MRKWKAIIKYIKECRKHGIASFNIATTSNEIIITANYPLSKEVLAQSDKLKMISVAFTGVDHLDLAYCQEKDIVVSNCAGYSTEAVAELTIGLIFFILLILIKHLVFIWLIP